MILVVVIVVVVAVVVINMQCFKKHEFEKLQLLLNNAKQSENPIAHYKLNEYMETMIDNFKQNRYSGSEKSNPCCETPMPSPVRNVDYNSAWIDT